MMLNKLSLNTIGLNRIGLNRIGKPSRGSSDRPYIDPEVLASLKVVCICYGKSNDDPDRAIIKNLVDPDNPFVISNAAFKLNSGFGKYEVDFTSWIQTNGVIASSDKVQNSITGRFLYFNTVNKKEDVPSFKVNITLGQQSKLQYNYIKEDGTSTYIVYSESGIYTIPASYFSKYTGGNALFGFYQIEGTSIIEQIPSFEGAFVNDGIDDLITSTKTVQEMGITDEVTVVSMIHQIGLGCRTNFICDKGSYWRCNEVANTGEGKTGIYGYSSTNISVNTPNIINNVLGDKVDYSVTGDRNDLTPSQFSVVGYISSSGKISYTSSVAWFWTIIANKVLTTDQINQVIAYYNLDRCVEPTVWYDVQKQGLTNETPAADWYLKDFSKNGFDMSLFNFAKKGNSGVGKYETDFTAWILDKVVDITISSSTFNSKTKNDNKINSWIVRTQDTVTPAMKVKITGITPTIESFIYRYSKAGGKDNYIYFTSDGIYELPKTDGISWEGFRIIGNNFNVTVEQIPSHAGALCFDGVEDYGKVTGLPIYKDYTVVADREIETINGGVLSKSYVADNGSFIFEQVHLEQDSTSSFGYTKLPIDNLNRDRKISYQSKYSYNGTSLSVGTGIDGSNMWLATIRDNDSRFSNIAIYSLMSFLYSMSEFLIERQLKKHKLGTLYPDMVEFRPIVKSNLPYSSISYSVNPGEYISVDSMVTITVTLPNTSDKLMEVSCNAISDISISGDNGVYEITGKVVKSPQKINLVISSYLTMLSNSTLISNETLIKNE